MKALFLLFLVSCSSYKLETIKDMRKEVKSGKADNALSTLNSTSFAKERNSRLLYLMQKGILEYYANNFEKANATFEEAVSLIDRQFTVRVSQKLKKVIINDSFDIYYGPLYEHSLVHYFSVLSSLQLFNKESKSNLRNKILGRMRSKVLRWESYLDKVKNARLGKSLFKDDMMAKILGAYIHELYGSRKYKETAFKLYEKAYELMLKNYNAYKHYNDKYKDYIENFSKLPHMSISKVKRKFISETPWQEEFKKFIGSRIIELAKDLRPRKINILKYRYGIKKLDSPRKGEKSVFIPLNMGFIPFRTAKKYNIGLNGIIENSRDESTKRTIRQIGIPLLTLFAADVLDLTPKGDNWNLPGQALGITTARVAVENFGVAFSLPEVKAKKELFDVELLFFQNGKIVKEKKAAIFLPLKDIAQEAVEEEALDRFYTVGARVGMKHLGAILSAYVLYKAMGKGTLAKSAAVIEYLALSKGIEASEYADLRSWSLLPSNIGGVNVYLKPGNYTVEAKVNGKKIPLGPIEVSKKRTQIFNKNVFF